MVLGDIGNFVDFGGNCMLFVQSLLPAPIGLVVVAPLTAKLEMVGIV